MKIYVAVLIAGVVACAGTAPPGAPLTLGARQRAVPPTGLCRVWDEGANRAFMAQTCDGIEYSAPLGSQILYRPDDGSRIVAVCFVSRSEPREIIGIDLFDVDSGRLVQVLQDLSDPRRGTSCREEYFQRR